MLRPDGTNAESRQTSHGVAGSSTTNLAPTPGQQFFSTRLTPSPHCSPHSTFSMLDRGSESMLRRIWNNDDGTDKGDNDLAKLSKNRPNFSEHAFPSWDQRFQNANANQCSAADPSIQSTFSSLHNLELEMETYQDTKARHRPVVLGMDLDAGLAALKLNKSDFQHTRAAPVLEPTHHRTLADAGARLDNQASAVFINNGFQAPEKARFSMWSAYGSPDASQRPPFDNSTSQWNTHICAGDRQVPTMSGRSRASSEAAHLDTMHRHATPKISTSCPPYPHLLQQRNRFHHANSPDALSFNYAIYTPNGALQHQQPRANSGFQPMHAVLTANGPNAFVPPPNPSPYDHQYQSPRQGPMLSQVSSRFSSRYHGMHTESNASADHLAPEENAGLWLTNLPPDVTHHELLSAIRNIGRIWCSYINEPDFKQHLTAAAKVVFFQPRAALRLLHFAATHGLSVRGFRIKVTQNRIKTPAQPLVGNISRVLIITGQSRFVNPEALMEYFSERFVFQLDQVRELISLGERTVVEFRFGSFRCQAQMGKMSLEKDRPEGFEKVEFGDDPCELGETSSSLAVAMQRIAGIGL